MNQTLTQTEKKIQIEQIVDLLVKKDFVEKTKLFVF